MSSRLWSPHGYTEKLIKKLPRLTHSLNSSTAGRTEQCALWHTQLWMIKRYPMTSLLLGACSWCRRNPISLHHATPVWFRGVHRPIYTHHIYIHSTQSVCSHRLFVVGLVHFLGQPRSKCARANVLRQQAALISRYSMNASHAHFFFSLLRCPLESVVNLRCHLSNYLFCVRDARVSQCAQGPTLFPLMLSCQRRGAGWSAAPKKIFALAAEKEGFLACVVSIVRFDLKSIFF